MGGKGDWDIIVTVERIVGDETIKFLKQARSHAHMQGGRVLGVWSNFFASFWSQSSGMVKGLIHFCYIFVASVTVMFIQHINSVVCYKQKYYSPKWESFSKSSHCWQKVSSSQSVPACSLYLTNPVYRPGSEILECSMFL